MIDLLIYGTGNNAQSFIKMNLPSNIRIVGFVEGIKNISEFCGYMVISPDKIKEYEYDYIFVSVFKNREIIDDLRDVYNIPSDRIIEGDYLNNLMLNIALKSYKIVMISDEEDYLNEPYDYKVDNFFLLKLFPEEIRAKKQWIIDNESISTRIIIVRSHILKRLLLNGLFEKLKAVLKEVKFVFILSNMVKGLNGYECSNENKFILSEIKKEFDLVITYHKSEAQQLGIMYYQQPFHKIQMHGDEKLYDVIFVGNAKDRLELLYQSFLFLKNNGIKPLFYINDVQEEKIIIQDGIVYNKRLPYVDYLRLVNRSSCIFEACYTCNESSMRYAEAVVYNKKLITNDNSVKCNSFYNDKYIKIYSKPSDIDVDFIKTYVDVNYNYDYQFEFERLIDYMCAFFNICIM